MALRPRYTQNRFKRLTAKCFLQIQGVYIATQTLHSEMTISNTNITTPLPERFTRCGFVWNQIKRERDFAIYSQTLEGTGSTRYCAFKIEIHQAWVSPAGRSYPARESVPSDTKWGEQAWTFFSLEKAEAKYAEISP